MNKKQRTYFNNLAEAKHTPEQSEQHSIDSHSLACALHRNDGNGIHVIDDFDEAQAEADFRVSYGLSSYHVSARRVLGRIFEAMSIADLDRLADELKRSHNLSRPTTTTTPNPR